MQCLALKIIPIVMCAALLMQCGDDDDLNPAGTGLTHPDYITGPDYVPASADSVGRSAFEDGSAARMAIYGVPQYYWGDAGNGDVPLVKITHAVTSRAVDVDVTFNPGFVDLTYGTGSVGWSPNRGHTFRDLVGSDHVEISVTNGAGEVVFHGRLDLISATTKTASGYASLGPFGGDGAIYIGKASDVLSFGSSLDDNINYYGYNLLENSPTTDSAFTRNAEYPNWQFYASYRITFDPAIFGSSGYGEVLMTSVHASPSKTPKETITVTEKPLPNPGTPDDPFRFYQPTTPSDSTKVPTDTTKVPTDTTKVPPDTSSVPPDTGIGVD